MAKLGLFSDFSINVKSRYFWNNPEISNIRKPLLILEQRDDLREARDEER